MAAEPKRKPARRPEAIDLPKREDETADTTHWPLLLTIKQFGRYVGLGETTVRELVQHRHVKTVRVPVLMGHKIFIKRTTAEEWVAQLVEEFA